MYTIYIYIYMYIHSTYTYYIYNHYTIVVRMNHLPTYGYFKGAYHHDDAHKTDCTPLGAFSFKCCIFSSLDWVLLRSMVTRTLTCTSLGSQNWFVVKLSLRWFLCAYRPTACHSLTFWNLAIWFSTTSDWNAHMRGRQFPLASHTSTIPYESPEAYGTCMES